MKETKNVLKGILVSIAMLSQPIDPSTHTPLYYNDIANPHFTCGGDGIHAFIPQYMLDKNNSFVIFYGNFSTDDTEATWRLYMADKNMTKSVTFITARC